MVLNCKVFELLILVGFNTKLLHLKVRISVRISVRGYWQLSGVLGDVTEVIKSMSVGVLLKTQDYFHFLTLARHQLLKIMCWLFSALALAVKNIVVIIFGPPGFFSNFQQISCRIFSEKFSRQISCQKAFV